MPYYDGSRSVMDDLQAARTARKRSDDFAHRAAYNRSQEIAYQNCNAATAAAQYAERAEMFKQQEISLTIAADQCSNAAFDMLTMGAYDDKWDIKRTV